MIFHSFCDLLGQRAREQPAKRAQAFLKDGITLESSWSYAELDWQARAMAVELLKRFPPGSRILLLFQPGLEFMAAFCGCLYAGCIAIPAPPLDAVRLKHGLPRLYSIVQDAEPIAILSTTDLLDILDRVAGGVLAKLDRLASDTIDLAQADQWSPFPVRPEDLAYLQYTSGSTSEPKGVMVSHAQLLNHSRAIQRAWRYQPGCVTVTWMPYFHDYGLVDGLIQPLYSGIPCYVLSPLTFLKRPLRWLEALMRYGGTHTQAPNFAYAHCLRKISPAERDTLDLSAIRVMSNGAEPIHWETLERFFEFFAPAGLRPEALYPSYGLAEATLLVTTKPIDTRPQRLLLSAEALQKHRIVIHQEMNASSATRSVVSCGSPIEETEVLIVEPETRRLSGPDEVGEIWMRAPGVASGYWQRGHESSAVFRAHPKGEAQERAYLRSGDLGFLWNGELYVTGRLKDVVIIDGCNHYPQDLEWTVQQSHPAVRADHCVAFAVNGDFGAEQLVILAEVEGGIGEGESIRSAIRRHIAETHGIDCSEVLLLKKGSLLKTSSGKLQRHACRKRWLDQGFTPLGTSLPHPLHDRRRSPPLTTGGLEADHPRSTDLPPDSWERGHLVHARTENPSTQKTEDLAVWIHETSALREANERYAPEKLAHFLADRLDLDPQHFDLDTPFANYGLSSRLAVSLVGDLEKELGRSELSPVLFWQYPTPREFIAYLVGNVVPTALASADRPPVAAIAVIGLACRFPGATTPSEFWSLIVAGKTAFDTVPPDRWKLEPYFDSEPGKPGKTYSRSGSFIRDVDQFDAELFGLSPREARYMDPQQRLLLEATWTALEHAGLSATDLAGRRVGVFIGLSSDDYAERLWHSTETLNPYSSLGKAPSMAAHRISYHFNFKGPSLVVDTACSSSLTAVHLACQSLHLGECELAIAGGVNLLLSPKMHIALSQAGFLSPTDRCRPFSAEADGYVRGEGCGLVVLKPLDQAEHDPIMALIRGSAVAQDGRSNGLTAPNGMAQQEVIREALQRAGVSPNSVSLIEAHGAGTRLGDPIEFDALRAVYGESSDPSCFLGSLKANIGHLEAAAGIAGLIKLVLALKARRIPPQIAFEPLNPLLNLSDSRLQIPRETQFWDSGEDLRRAAISAFGFGGTNVHLILEEAPSESARSGEPESHRWHGLALSAKTPQGLKDLAEAYGAWLEAHRGVHLADLCHTANTGRVHFPVRRVFLTQNLANLQKELRAWTEKSEIDSPGKPQPHSSTRFIADPPFETSEEYTRLEATKRRYEQGEVVDWRSFYRGRRRLSDLPGYSFRRHSHWLPAPDEKSQDDSAAGRVERSEPQQDASPTTNAETIQWLQPVWTQKSRRTTASPIVPTETLGTIHSPSSFWLILSEETSVAVTLTEELTKLGLTAHPVLWPNAATADDDELTEKLREPGLIGVIYLPASDHGLEEPERCGLPFIRLIAWLRSLHESPFLQGEPSKLGLWVLTRQGIGLPYECLVLQQSLSHVTASAAMLEYPKLCRGVVDLPVQPIPEDYQELVATLLERNHEGSILIRGGQRYVRRLRKRIIDVANPPVFQANAAYWVTGGLGALGRILCRWLIDHGARYLGLIGRSPLDSQRRVWLDELRAAGAEVLYIPLDVGDRIALEKGLATLEQELPPVRGIWHLAGVAGRKLPFHQWTREALAAVLRPKVQGAWWLHQYLQNRPLDHFVCFSSIASVWGSEGRAAYAMANHFLDSLMHDRRARELPGLSINWGPFQGDTLLDAELKQQLPAWGIEAWSADEAFRALAGLFSDPPAQAVLCPADWERLAALYATRGQEALFQDWLIQPETDRRAGGTPALPEALSCWERELQRLVADLTGHTDAHALPLDEGFFALGLDSLLSLEFNQRLGTLCGAPIPPTSTFDHPNIRKLARYLAERDNLRPSHDAAKPPPSSESDDSLRKDQSPATSSPREKIRSPLTARQEPIAVIGLGCRYPGGVDHPEDYWRLLLEGRDAIGPLPEDRHCLFRSQVAEDWPQGGFMTAIDGFDAQFFGITPREAASMDPQQRILLEVAYAALEHAAHLPDRRRGEPGGVFIGASQSDYATLLDLSDIDLHHGTGSSLNALAGRLSYFLGWTGPSLVVDTACSSSLVAVHLACQSLAAGECRIALAGGVNLLLASQSYAALRAAQMLSPKNRCRSFDAGADGYVRGEGCGVIVLKRLEEALASGDRIFAVIRGSAVNQDGASSGLTVPNGVAQEAVIRTALTRSGWTPGEIDVIEAHGTGTALGDPIEVGALERVFAEHRGTNHPLWIGSVKTNIGHLEAAAGIAGLQKAILSLYYGQIPRHLHYQTPNPYIPWTAWPVRVPTTIQDWPSKERRVAGVSAFGFTGTNAHVVVGGIEQDGSHPDKLSPSSNGTIRAKRRPHLLLLSALSKDALQDLARSYLATGDWSRNAGALCIAAATRRSHFPHRLALHGNSQHLLEALHAVAQNQSYPRLQQGDGSRPRKLVFVFSGQGSQSIGMGRALYEREKTFRAAFERVAEIADRELDRPLKSLIYPTTPTETRRASLCLEQTRYTQAALFAVQYALTEWYRAAGIEPAAVLGHSVGECVAAVLAGALGLEEALHLVLLRGRLVESLPAGGGLLAVQAAETELNLNQEPPGRFSLAAVNAPRQVVVAGAVPDLERLAATLREQGLRSVRLQVSHAFHSHRLDPVLEAFTRQCAAIAIGAPVLPYYSGLHGGRYEAALDSAYWTHHLRHTVRFREAVLSAQQDGYDLFLEIGPRPVLLSALRQTLGEEGTGLASLSGEGDALDEAVASLGQLYTQGVEGDWERFFGRVPPRLLPILPTYPFQRPRLGWNSLLSSSSFSSSMSASDRSIQAVHSKREEIPSTPPIGDLGSPRADETSSFPGLSEPLIGELTELLRQIAGIPPEQAESDRTLFELGLDSLLLVQFQQAIERRFQVSIALPEFYRNLGSVRKIAHYLAQLTPSESISEWQNPQDTHGSPQGASIPEPSSPDVTENTPLERLMQTQLKTFAEFMNRQLEVLSQANWVAPETRETHRPKSADLSSGNIPESLPAAPHARREPRDFPENQNCVRSSFLENQVPGLYRPLHSVRLDGLSAEQETALTRLIENYNARTPKSKAYAAAHRRHFAHNRQVAFRPEWKEMVYPIAVDHAEGARLWDIDGNEYLDLTLGFGVHLFGHHPPFVTRAIADGLNHGGLAIGPLSPVAGEVAGLFCAMTRMERVAFFNTGSEAVMVALRLARAVTGRDRIVLFSGAYHGSFDGVLATGWAHDDQWATFPLAPGTPQSLVEEVIVLPYGDLDSLRFIEQRGNELAAVLVEPVQSRHPDRQPLEFLQGLRAITEASGTALIFDEMILGFRLHQGGAQAWFGIEADLATYGKILGGGLPIGAVAGRSRFLDAIDGGAWQYGDDSMPSQRIAFVAGTFNIHPLAMVAARSVLTELQRQGPQLQEHLNHRTETFCRELNLWFRKEAIPLELLYCGSLFRFQLSPEIEILHYYLLARGIFVWEGRNCFFSTAHSDEDIADIAAMLKQCLLDMRQDGWLPPRECHGSQALRGNAVSDAPCSITPKTRRSPSLQGDRGWNEGEASPDSGNAAWMGFASLHPSYQTISLSPEQQALWFLATTAPAASLAYTETVVLEVPGRLDHTRLEHALNRVVERHELLRFSGTDGETQKIAEQWRFHLEKDEAKGSDFEQIVEHWMNHLAENPFDLASGPLLRARLLILRHGRHFLSLSAHHLVADGWSLGLILQEWAAFYGDLRDQGNPRSGKADSWKTARALEDLPPPERFEAFLEWRRWLRTTTEVAAHWWRERLAEPPAALELPGDRARPVRPSYLGGRCQRILPLSLVDELRALSRRQGVGLFGTLLTGVAAWLSALSGASEFCLGIPIAGQSCSGLRQLVGPCSLNLPLRISIDDAVRFSDALATQQQALLEAQAHQQALFAPDSPPLPPLTVLFNLDRSVPLTFDGLPAKLRLPPVRHGKKDLFINVLDSGDGLSLDIDYAVDLFDPERIERWLELLLSLFGKIVANPNASLGDLCRDLPRPPPPSTEIFCVRGYRINRLEIERCLLNGPDIEAARVIPWQPNHQAGSIQLVAFFASATIDEAKARHWLLQRLPPEQCPDHWRRAPRAWLEIGQDDATLLARWSLEPQENAANDEIESRLRECWQEILGLATVRPQDAFLTLGGNSLKALRLSARIAEIFGVTLSLGELLKAPTCADWAGLIRNKRDRLDREPSQATIPAMSSSETASGLKVRWDAATSNVYPLSPAQRRLWMSDALQPGLALYNLPMALTLPLDLDVAALQQAWTDLVARHAALRSRFYEEDGWPWQSIAESVPFALPVVEMPGESALRGYLDDFVLLPFFLNQTPYSETMENSTLLRAVLLKLPQRQVLAINIHHIIGDAWSMGVLLRDLFAFYRNDPLPPLAFQYQDYALRQNDAWQSPLRLRQRDYWLQRLTPLPAPLNLPTSKPRPKTRSFQAGRLHSRLETRLVAALNGLCQTKNVTLFTGFMTLCQIFLRRLSGATEITVGTVSSGRDDPALHDLIGFFVNTLVIRSTLDEVSDFPSHLAATHKILNEAYQNQDYPFDLLIEQLPIPRDPNRNPLFEVMIVMDDRSDIEALAGRCGFGIEDLEAPGSPFELMIYLGAPDGEGLPITWIYATEIFSEESVRQWMGLFQEVAEACLTSSGSEACPERGAFRPALAQKVLTGASHARSLPEAFRQQAEISPDTIALTHEGETLSYRRLDELSTELAQRLSSAGVMRGENVGLCLERSPELIVALLGILKTGAAYVPLDPDYPQERLAFMSQDAGLRWMVTTISSMKRLTALPVRFLLLDQSEDSLSARSSLPEVAQEDRAYVIYTSGSTGQPKGVAITHGQVLQLFEATQVEFGFNADDVWSLFHSYAFDFSVWEIWGALLHGGRLVIVPHEVARSPEDFYALLVRARVTILNQTPTAFYGLLAVDREQETDRLTLRQLIFGGEKLDFGVLADWYQRHADDAPRLVNMYGITETTVHVTYRPLSRSDAQASGSLIGQPLPDLEIWLMDEQGQPTAPGEPGEIYVGGARVAEGYLNRPELTAERFRPHPQIPGRKLYRSGDWARWTEQGELEYLGRHDHQVKIRGFRVELGEIEAVLGEHPEVMTSHVIIQHETDRLPRLLAYYLPRTSHAGLTTRLTQMLRRRLPDYLQPAALIEVAEFPLTANGKVDLDRLPLIKISESTLAFVPQHEEESCLLRIWSELLKRPTIGPHDNFFELGGDSILAIQIASRCRRAGLPLSPKRLFEYQTLSELAAYCRLNRNSSSDDFQESPGNPSFENDYPLTPTQEGMLYHSLQETSDPAYFEQVRLDFSGWLEPTTMQSAWRLVFDRHPMLRASIHWLGLDRPVQRIHAEVSPEWAVFDWRECLPDEIETHWTALLAEDRRRPFDLTQAPLMRFYLLLLPEQCSRLLWTQHHILIDGWSGGIVLRDLLHAYQSLSLGESPVLGPVPPYRHYLEWIARQDFEAAAAFWRTYLDGFQASPALGHLGGSAVTHGSSGYQEQSRVLDPCLAERLSSRAEQERITLSTLFQGAWALWLAEQSGIADVVFGITVAGRPVDLPGVEEMVGLFINTLPLRARSDLGKPMRSWFQGLQADYWEVSRYAHISLADIRAWSACAATEELFESILVFENFPMGDLALTPGDGGGRGENHRQLPVAPPAHHAGKDRQNPITLTGVCAYEHTHYPLTLMVTPVNQSLHVQLSYAKARFDAADAEGILAQLLTILERLDDDWQTLTLEELLSGWTAPAVDPTLLEQATTPLHEDF